MRAHETYIHSVLSVTASILAVACGGSISSPGESGEPVAISSSKLLASVQTKTGGTIEFSEDGPGHLSVVESLPRGQTPVIDAAMRKLSLAQMYSELDPDHPVPQTILDAMADVKSGSLTAGPGLNPPPQTAQKSENLFYDFNSWFSQNFCASGSGVTECDQADGAVNSGWYDTTIFTAFGGVGGGATGPGTMTVYGWNGSSDTVIWTGTINPGWELNYTRYDAPNAWHFAGVSQAPGTPEEDIAVAPLYPTVVATQTAGNAVQVSGENWWAETQVSTEFTGLPPNNAVWFLCNGGVSNGSFSCVNTELVCRTTGGETPISVLAYNSYPYGGEQAVENGYVQRTCY